MSRGHNRDYGDVYPYTLDGSYINIIEANPNNYVDYADFETIFQRYTFGSVSDSSQPSGFSLNKYDNRDMNRVLMYFNSYVPEDTSYGAMIIKGLCNSAAGIDYLGQIQAAINPDLICNNEQDCSDNESINLQLLCPNGESDILNPINVLCRSGVSCDYDGRCIPVDGTIFSPDGSCGERISDAAYEYHSELCNDDNCKYIPPIFEMSDEYPNYIYPCIVYSNICKNDETCNELMINISKLMIKILILMINFTF